MIEILSFMLLALALGFKHSYDADHILAVSNILRKINSMKSAIKIGFSWAFGHMLTAGIVTIALYFMKEKITVSVFQNFEIFVGIMLISLGIWSLIDTFKIHSHLHSHGSVLHSHAHVHERHGHDFEKHAHRHMLGIGVIHGLASNDELLILLTASLGVASLGSVLLGIGFFSIGVIAGMVLFTILISFPLIKTHSGNLYKIFSLGTGTISIVYGLAILV